MTKPHVILITGANRGIGWAAAQGLASAGHTVYVGSRRLEEAQKIIAETKNLIPLEIDVSSELSVNAAYDRIAQNSGMLDALVNNAGVLLDDQSKLNNSPLETFQKTFDVNFFGVIRVTQKMITLLLKSKLEKPLLPKIVNVSSTWGSMAAMSNDLAPVPAYHTSKAALNMLTLNLANNYKGKIAVNSICPGWCRTRMGGESAIKTPEQGARVILKIINSEELITGQFLNDKSAVAW